MKKQEFELADGKKVLVQWLEGPPYLKVSYTQEKEVECTNCEGTGGDRDCTCPRCHGHGVVKQQTYGD